MQNLLKEISGGKQLYWNNEKKKPDFWAQDVPLKKVWQDTDSTDKSKWNNLTKLMEAMYRFHGYDPKTWVQESNQVNYTLFRQIMQPGKTYHRTCFAWAKDADGKFCLGKRCHCKFCLGNRCQRQPSANHIKPYMCTKKGLIDT